MELFHVVFVLFKVSFELLYQHELSFETLNQKCAKLKLSFLKVTFVQF